MMTETQYTELINTLIRAKHVAIKRKDKDRTKAFKHILQDALALRVKHQNRVPPEVANSIKVRYFSVPAAAE